MNLEEKKIRYYRQIVCLLYIYVTCFTFSSCELLKKEEVEFSTTESYEEGKTESAVSSTESSQETRTTVQDTGFYYVYICGQVMQPGVYELEAGKRVNDVVTMAGGFTEDADESSLNLARQVVDGEQIYVLSKQEAKTAVIKQTVEGSSQGQESQSQNEQQKININTASKEELMTLSGIGEAKADSIISYREANGPFSSIEDIKQIDGIKDGIFLKIKDQIMV